MAFESDKKFPTEFIEIYHPALRKIKSDLSKNEHLRNVGLDELMEKCKDKCPEADREFVKKKINNLRTHPIEVDKQVVNSVVPCMADGQFVDQFGV